MVHKVFISYSKDNFKIRDDVFNELEKVPGIKVIYEKKDIPKAQDKHPTIPNLLDEADCIVPILTRESMRCSKVLGELERGHNREKKIIPFIEEKLREADLPFYLRGDIRRIKYNNKNIDDKLSILIDIIKETFGIELKSPQAVLDVPESFSFYGEKLGRIIEDVGSGDLVLFLISENAARKQGELIGYLNGTLDEQNERKISSGFSYWGIGPTNMWVHACNDDFYFMKKSINDFPKIWEPIYKSLPKKPYHYVSLGIGTGKKDSFILKKLCALNPDLIYVPVDMSPEMLRHGVSEVRRSVEKITDKFKGTQILPFQTDFSDPGKIKELRQILNQLVHNEHIIEPIIFGLLGNTISNFDNDRDTLKDISSILQPDDLFLLEIARVAQIDQKTINKAMHEYNQPAFKNFALSSLLQITDLDITTQNLKIETEIETIPNGNNIITKALKILSYYYVDMDNENKKIRLADGRKIAIEKNDKPTRIRLYLSRKYTNDGIDDLIKYAGLEVHEIQKSESPSENVEVEIQLLLLKKKD